MPPADNCGLYTGKMTKPVSQKKLLLLIVTLLVLASVFLGRFFSLDIEKIQTFFRGFPLIFACVLFIVFYVAANFFVFWDVKDLLKPLAAVFFGAYLSTLLIYIAEIINATLFFNLSKRLGQDFVERSLRGKFRNFYEKLENISFIWIFLLRLIILIPYRVLDISFGLSKVSFRKYMAAVLLASPPRIFWIQFIMASVGGFSLGKIMNYYQENPHFTAFIFLYFFISIILALILKKKFN